MQWTEDLSVGIDLIDDQHRELFKRIDDLLQSIRSSTCKYTIGDTLKFLEEYVIVHFGDEERAMAAHGYPGLKEHVDEHQRFISDFEALKAELQSEASNYSKSVSTNQIVVDWIVGHIKKRDCAYGAYMRSRAR